ncbi:branched-chain amino acid aminotransferase [Actinomyces vulturis]|uniref:branched-chain amino acid aminotransferase n=1 Tax=Actinomyces vulturis TaxID=1857645 RepID=UPI0008372576|nr:branched-chain amino acid aminotransferase [Actinomyces vulturis]
MSDNESTTLTPLAQAASIPVPPADELAGRFPLHPNPTPVTDQQREEHLASLSFGTVFSDHMAYARFTDGQWQSHSVVPYGPIALSPAASVLHYGQEVFEGIKAYRHEDGSIWTFRPRYNAARFNASARRLALPELCEDDFVASLVDLVRADAQWVPSAPGSSLYLRPFMFASEAFLGVKPAHTVDYYVIASPSGAYFKGGFTPVSIWVTTDYHRAGRGGTGAAKTSGNYAASLLPQQQAYDNDCDQVCFLDDVTQTTIEELGGMNLFVVDTDGTIRTPRLTGTILEGGTRSAIITLLTSKGYTVKEDTIILSELTAQLQAGTIAEIFACGTAAVVTPVGRLKSETFDLEVPVGELTPQIHRTLTDIQYGRVEDPFGWMYKIC